jgi:hypothetical protein
MTEWPKMPRSFTVIRYDGKEASISRISAADHRMEWRWNIVDVAAGTYLKAGYAKTLAGACAAALEVMKR